MKIFKSNKIAPLMHDRVVVATGPFGMSLSATCLSLVGAAVVLHASIWAIEGPVLIELFGFDLPLPIKICSCITTLMLFSVLFHSTAMMYMLLCSCVNYIVVHTMLFAGLLSHYVYYSAEHYALYRMIYIEKSNVPFIIFSILTTLRLLVTLPLAYYILVLALIRINGGTGWECRSAVMLEQTHIDTQIDDLRDRKEWVKLVNQKMAKSSAAKNDGKGQVAPLQEILGSQA